MMIFQCCCICHGDALAAIQSGTERFTVQSGMRLEAASFLELPVAEVQITDALSQCLVRNERTQSRYTDK